MLALRCAAGLGGEPNPREASSASDFNWLTHLFCKAVLGRKGPCAFETGQSLIKVWVTAAISIVMNSKAATEVAGTTAYVSIPRFRVLG